MTPGEVGDQNRETLHLTPAGTVAEELAALRAEVASLRESIAATQR